MKGAGGITGPGAAGVTGTGGGCVHELQARIISEANASNKTKSFFMCLPGVALR
jgi:hypothetical protein